MVVRGKLPIRAQLINPDFYIILLYIVILSGCEHIHQFLVVLKGIEKL